MSHQPLLSRILFVYCLLAVSAAPARAQAETASISGRVTLNGAPTRGVKVSLVPGPYGSAKTPGRQSARTDDDGRFEFKGLAAGRYGILVASYVYVSEDLFSQSARPFKLCTVTAGEALAGQDLRLVRGGAITGRVTLADGRPAIAERLTLSYVDASGKSIDYSHDLNSDARRTDDRGVYRIFGLPPGRYRLSVGQDPGEGRGGSGGVFHRRVYYPGVASEERAKLIEVRESAEVADIDLQLGVAVKTYAIRGRVIDTASGKPSPGGLTDFYLMDARTHRLRAYSFGNSANDRGEFSYSGLPPGQYGVAGTNDPRRNVQGDLLPVEIKDEDVEGIEIKLLPGAAISGTVAFEGDVDAAAVLRRERLWIRPIWLDAPETAPRPNNMPVEAQGGFRLNGLAPGKYRLDQTGGEPDLSLTRVELNGALVQEAFTVKSGEQIAGVRLVFSPRSGALRGRIVVLGSLAAGERIAAALRPVAGGEQLARTILLSESLTFVEQPLAVGEYEIVVTIAKQVRELTRRRVTIREGAPTEISIEVRP
ncbi:MAG: carboxypeptidase regulatory-like domain-containing protein [Blastocatellia bacterium]|nr:carboxypeptidase regulatory-like domain-containing protein [Blastocatellia bacterium]